MQACRRLAVVRRGGDFRRVHAQWRSVASPPLTSFGQHAAPAESNRRDELRRSICGPASGTADPVRHDGATGGRGDHFGRVSGGVANLLQLGICASRPADGRHASDCGSLRDEDDARVVSAQIIFFAEMAKIGLLQNGECVYTVVVASDIARNRASGCHAWCDTLAGFRGLFSFAKGK